MAAMATRRLINRRILIKQLGLSGSLLSASQGFLYRAFAQNPATRTFGIDVSKWGGEIDWHDVISTLNPRFVFLQAYHMGKHGASSYANPRFANYRQALQRLGLLHATAWRHSTDSRYRRGLRQQVRATGPKEDRSDRKNDTARLDYNRRSQADHLHEGTSVEGTRRSGTILRLPVVGR
jgi:GH25 family lysozyme M1 (1,4-beta-N-acetylmuramidase)